jgi:hypothetical protein
MPAACGLRDRVRHLVREVEQALRRERLAVENLAERLAVDELHRDEDRLARGSDLVDRDDVLVVQRRRRARLLLEALAPVRVGGELRREDLDGDLAPEARVSRAIDLAHPSGAERREDLERTEARSGRERHGRGGAILTAKAVQSRPFSDEVSPCERFAPPR